MNAPAVPRPAPSLARRLALPLVFLGTLALLVIGITSFFRLNRDARTLRDSLCSSVEAQAGEWSEKIELSAGAITFGALRIGTSFLPLEPEVRAALRSVRGAEVGLYDLSSDPAQLDHCVMLAAADGAMEKRGWDRLVGVAKAREFVAVYVPKDSEANGRLRACLAVAQGRQIVVISARANVTPLVELLEKRGELALRSPGERGGLIPALPDLSVPRNFQFRSPGPRHSACERPRRPHASSHIAKRERRGA